MKLQSDYQGLSYLPEWFRQWIEEHFYARINAQASFDQILSDPEVLQNVPDPVVFYSDHGVVHAWDVTAQVIQTLNTIHGVLIPQRSDQRLAFMIHYGALLAYLHDTGMIRFSHFGRTMHPEFAAQLVFRPMADDIVDRLWQEDVGGIATRLTHLATNGVLVQPPTSVFREILAMCICHSKSKVAIEVLNNPPTLRRLMQQVLTHNLGDLYQIQHPQATIQDHLANQAHDEYTQLSQHLSTLYQNFEEMSFAWLTADTEGAHSLVMDVIDTLRALRCADALRKRGTVLKTSGNYEIFVDSQTGEAITAIRKGTDALFMVRTPSEMKMGEANLASCELTPDGDLRIAFHRGRFANEDAFAKAAHAAAFVVHDIQSDILTSFQRTDDVPCPKPHVDMCILLEAPDEAAEFAQQIRVNLIRRNPSLQRRIRVVPSLQDALPTEVVRYLSGKLVPDDTIKRQDWLNQIAASGQNINGLIAQRAFEHVRIVQVAVGERLVEAGAPSGFVYIPMSDGLMIYPLGGYPAIPGHAWMPIGATGVIRGSVRNGTVLAEKALSLLMIPKMVYLQEWYRPYTISEFLQSVQQPNLDASKKADPTCGS